MSDMTSSPDQGAGQSPVGPSSSTARPSPGSKGSRRRRPVKVPVEMKVNLTELQGTALQQVAQFKGVPDSVIARIAINEYLVREHPQYARILMGNGNNA